APTPVEVVRPRRLRVPPTGSDVSELGVGRRIDRLEAERRAARSPPPSPIAGPSRMAAPSPVAPPSQMRRRHGCAAVTGASPSGMPRGLLTAPSLQEPRPIAL